MLAAADTIYDSLFLQSVRMKHWDCMIRNGCRDINKWLARECAFKLAISEVHLFDQPVTGA